MTGKKTVIATLIAIVIVLAVLLGVFHRAVHLSFRNLTVGHIRLPQADDWQGGQALMGLRYAEASDANTLDLYLPDGVERPRLYVIIHGGGFIAGDSQTQQTRLMIRYFRDHGYACATLNYRLAQEAPFPAAIEDCKAAIRWLRANAVEYGYDADSIAVFGESAGGYLATMCAVTTDEEFSGLPFAGQTEGDAVSARVDALVNYYGYTDIYPPDADLKTIGLPKLFFRIANSWMGDSTDGYEDIMSYWLRRNLSEMTREERDVADPLYYIRKNAEALDGLRVWMIHGDCDLTVPLPVSERMYACLAEAIGPERVTLRVEPNMGHASDPLYADEILAEVDAFIRGDR